MKLKAKKKWESILLFFCFILVSSHSQPFLKNLNLGENELKNWMELINLLL